MKKLKVLTTFLANPKKVITIGYQEFIMRKNRPDYKSMVKNKFGITQLPTIDLLELFPDFNDTLEYYSFLIDTSLITDILLLKNLAKRFPSCEYLEIGSLRGESIAAVAGVAKHCVSLTLSPQEMRDFKMHDNYIKMHGIYSKGIPNVTTYLHNSLTFDYSQLNEKFDLIFVDGDHSYSSVVQDTKNVFKQLKNENSIIVWHDYGVDVENVRHEVFAAILEGMPPEEHKHLYHVSNTLCAVYIKGKFNTTFNDTINLPNKVFKVSISAQKL